MQYIKCRPRQRRLNGKKQNYQIVWWDPITKQERTKSTKTTIKKDANAICRKFEKQINSQIPDSDATRVLVDDVLIDYMDLHVAHNPIERNRKTTINVINRTIDLLPKDLYVSELNSALVQKFLVKHYSDILLSALNYAVKETRKLDNYPPFRGRPSYKPRTDHLKTEKEIQKFLIEAMLSPFPHITLFTQIAIITGQRKTAILELRWHPNKEGGHVDFENNEIDFNGGRKKNKKKRSHIEIPDELLPILALEYQKWKQSKRNDDSVIYYNGGKVLEIKKGLKTVAVKAGFPEIGAHDLRRTAITRAVRSGEHTSDQICDYFAISAEVYRRHYSVYEPKLNRFKTTIKLPKIVTTVSNTVSFLNDNKN